MSAKSSKYKGLVRIEDGRPLVVDSVYVVLARYRNGQECDEWIAGVYVDEPEAMEALLAANKIGAAHTDYVLMHPLIGEPGHYGAVVPRA